MEWKHTLTIFNLGTRWIKRLGSEIKYLYENHEGSAAHVCENTVPRECSGRKKKKKTLWPLRLLPSKQTYPEIGEVVTIIPYEAEWYPELVDVK
jgi:hypothetical protein